MNGMFAPLIIQDPEKNIREEKTSLEVDDRKDFRIIDCIYIKKNL